MSHSIRLRVVPVACVLALLLIPSPSAAQETLARAKEYYASASYEEALQLLEKIGSEPGVVKGTEIASYQVFCLVALGRSAEAKQAIESIVRVDPLFHLPESQASPRVRAFFDDVRRPMLPDVVRQSYARAKDAFEKKEMEGATTEFDRVIALVDELGSSDSGVSDLRTLAVGFRDLSRAAVASAKPAPPPPVVIASEAAVPPSSVNAPRPGAPAGSMPAPVVDTTRVYSASDSGVARPTPVARAMPVWRPENAIEARRSFRGALELVISEDGKVLSAGMLMSVTPSYDVLVLKATQDWRFKPALVNGTPVKFRYTMDINIGATR